MIKQTFPTPLKIGLLSVVTAYFLFTLHAMFTLSWIGEWNRLGGGSFGTMILVEDISATTGLVFRFAASIIAFIAVISYLSKKEMAKSTAYKIFRVVLVFEGIYWLGLVATAGYSIQGFASTLQRYHSLSFILNSLGLNVIPTVLEAVILPIVLFIFAFKLNPNKPFKIAIKWGSITGTVYILVFWLINSSIWVGLVDQKGTQLLTAHPENLVSYILTVFGLLALTIYSTYFTAKSARAENIQDLKLSATGGILLALGLYFLWNYLSWVLFAGILWNNWYAWFLGHNMDLWMLSLPLLGLPLLFAKRISEVNDSS